MSQPTKINLQHADAAAKQYGADSLPAALARVQAIYGEDGVIVFQFGQERARRDAWRRAKHRLYVLCLLSFSLGNLAQALCSRYL